MRLKALGPGDQAVAALVFCLYVLQVPEDLVDDVDDRLGRPLTFGELIFLDGAERSLEPRQNLAHAAAPAINGLLDVADAEERPSCLRRGLHDELRKRPQHLPLRQRSVLKLFEQQGFARAVEFVCHSLCSRRKSSYDCVRDFMETNAAACLFERPEVAVKMIQQLPGGLRLPGGLAD